MKTTTYAKLSKFVGKSVNELNYSVTEFTEEKIFEYATNKYVAYRTIQDNYTGIKDVKVFDNLKGIKKSRHNYPDIHKLFDSKYDNKGKRDDIPRLVKEFIKAKSVSDETFYLMKSLMNDRTELNFTDSNLKLEYNSAAEPLKITFFCLNALVVQVLIAPTYNKK